MRVLLFARLAYGDLKAAGDRLKEYEAQVAGVKELTAEIAEKALLK
jgi:hypothetical protein